LEITFIVQYAMYSRIWLVQVKILVRGNPDAIAMSVESWKKSERNWIRYFCHCVNMRKRNWPDLI